MERGQAPLLVSSNLNNQYSSCFHALVTDKKENYLREERRHCDEEISCHKTRLDTCMN